MTDLLDLHPDPPARPRRRRRRGLARLLAVLVVLGLTLALAAGGVLVLRTFLQPAAEDYPGPGTGEAVVQIQPGDTAGDVASTLAAADVVASREAFFEVARDDPRSTSLQPGHYRVRQQMAAADALDLLLDPEARVVGRVTIPEGRTVAQTLQTLSEGTDLPLAELQAAADDPSQLGLPDWAPSDELEGFLFPATYEFQPGATAVEVLSTMVDRFEQAAETTGLVRGAAELGRTPYEVLIVASLIEREVRHDDEYGKVARVVYNRLDQGIPLGIDAAVLYGVGKEAGGEVTASDLAQDTPYENRRQTGLPPTPIASPGEATLTGALQPVDGDILYYVLATEDGRSFFTADYQEFLEQRDKSRAEGIF